MSKGTWEINTIPPGRKLIGCKWVFDLKFDSLGKIIRYKARLVAKGFTQIEGTDYAETFAPVISIEGLRIALSIAQECGASIEYSDFTVAFLNGDLDEEIYMTIPPGLDLPTHNEHGVPLSCRLKKALYGLKQSSRQWYAKLHALLTSPKLGFKRCISEPCLYIKYDKDGKNFVMLAIYVDDIIEIATNTKLMEWIKTELKDAFEITHMGPIKWCLGLEITRTADYMYVTQMNYVSEILERFNMQDSASVPTPAFTKVKLTSDDCPIEGTDEWQEMKNVPYAEAVGCLIYASVRTRPDITVALQDVARFTKNPGRVHWTAVKRILRYLKGTINMGLRYEKRLYGHKNKITMVTYTDADHASDHATSTSKSGYIILLNGGPVIYGTKKQDCVVESTDYAEYIAMSEGVKRVIWLRDFLHELGFSQDKPSVIYCDNTAAIATAKNPLTKLKAKHIRIRYHEIVREQADGQVEFTYVNSAKNLADIFTKNLAIDAYIYLRDQFMAALPKAFCVALGFL
jgi:hypothetical protein